MAMIIDGKKISKEIKDELKAEVAALKGQGKEPSLAVILVGDDPASQVYVGNKKKACEYIGIRSISHELPADTSQEQLLTLIGELNADNNVNGILVQLPLPEAIAKHEEEILKCQNNRIQGIAGMHIWCSRCPHSGHVD